MRSNIVLVHQFLSLCSAEAVLFIYDDECQVFKFDRFLCQGVSADKDGNLASRHPLQKLGAGDIGPPIRVYFRGELATTASSDQGNVYWKMGEIFYKRFEVLLGKYFCRGHVSTLKRAEVLPFRFGNCGRVNRGRGHRCFTRTNIAFQEATHGMSTVKVV